MRRQQMFVMQTLETNPQLIINLQAVHKYLMGAESCSTLEQDSPQQHF